MGTLKTLFLGLVAGAAIAYLAYNRVNRESERLGIEPSINSVRRYAGLEDSTTQAQPLTQPQVPAEPQITPSQKNQGNLFNRLFSIEPIDKNRKVEPWNYNGLTWPEEWPVMNADGSYNRDYIHWYMRNSRGMGR